MNKYFRTLWFLLLLASSTAQAALTIEITQGVEGAVPIAVVPFGWADQAVSAPENISAIISADLDRSGRFAALPDRDLVAFPTEGEQVQFKNWRMVNVDYLVIGRINPAAHYLRAVPKTLLWCRCHDLRVSDHERRRVAARTGEAIPVFFVDRPPLGSPAGASKSHGRSDQAVVDPRERVDLVVVRASLHHAVT